MGRDNVAQALFERGLKRCSRCKNDLPLEDFHKHGSGNLNAACVPCANAYNKEKYEKRKKRFAADPQAKEKYNARKTLCRVARRYGLTPEEYIVMLEDGCAVCGSTEYLHVDHDHSCCPNDAVKTCGKCTRGILCARHNTGMGKFRDSKAELQAAIAYLESYRSA